MKQKQKAKKVNEKKYQTPKLRRFFIEMEGWIFLVGIVLGIWVEEYRYRLIFTALFSIFLASMLVMLDNAAEEKFNKRKEKNK